MNLLRLFVPENWSPDDQDVSQWFWVTDTGLKGSRLGRGLPTGFRTQVFLPASEVLTLDIDLPRKGRWREALPFAVEEYLLGDLNNTHIVSDIHIVSPLTRAQILDRNWLNQLLAYLKEQGVRADEMYSQSAVISNQPNEWTVLINAHGAFLVQQSGLTHALDTVEGDGPPFILKKILNEKDKTQTPTHLRLIWEGITPDRVVQVSDAWSEALGVRCTIEGDFKGHAMRPLSAHASNVLTGEFSSESANNWHKLNRPLKLTLILVAVTILVWVLSFSIQTWLWGNTIRQLKAQTETELRRAFPETRSILNPQLQMQKGLADLRAQAGNYSSDELPALLGRLKELGDIDYAHLISLDYQNQNALLVWQCDSADQAETLLGRLKQLGLEGTLKADSNGQNVMLKLIKATP